MMSTTRFSVRPELINLAKELAADAIRNSLKEITISAQEGNHLSLSEYEFYALTELLFEIVPDVTVTYRKE